MGLSRRAFFGKATAVTATVAVAGDTAAASPQNTTQTQSEFYPQLVKATDAAVSGVLHELAHLRPHPYVRRVGSNLETVTAVFCDSTSAHYRSDALIQPIQKISATLLHAQHPDGTIDAGNLHSPPDTAFVLETVCTSFSVLRGVHDPRLASAKANLKKFILAAGEALVTGGVHTPNHRWVVSSALARVNGLFPGEKYVRRIDDWLGEGVYNDMDGQYCERSTGIYSRVIDTALITMARLLHRPDLLEPVRRNLGMNLYYMHPDGEVETIGSRRQDQHMVEYISNYYLEYRYLAIKDSNPTFAAMVRFIEEREIGKSRIGEANPLINFLEEPLLKNKLPAGGSLPSHYAKLFTNTAMARIRHGDVSVSVYGGSDWPRGSEREVGVASGLASNPTFFTFRKGGAILESVRMGARFFSEGAFHSVGLTRRGNSYTLNQRYEVPYYQPLPAEKRNRRGDYELTPVKDCRFWSKMDFTARPMSNIQVLDQKVSVVANGEKCALHFDISGPDHVPFTIELAFRAGGKLEGTLIEKMKDRLYILKQGTGRYTVDGYSIEFGPGEAAHDWINLSGFSYMAHHAVLRPNGCCVYITGLTPFQKLLTIG